MVALLRVVEGIADAAGERGAAAAEERHAGEQLPPELEPEAEGDWEGGVATDDGDAEHHDGARADGDGDEGVVK